MRRVLAFLFAFMLAFSIASVGNTANACPGLFPDDPGFGC